MSLSKFYNLKDSYVGKLKSVTEEPEVGFGI